MYNVHLSMAIAYGPVRIAEWKNIIGSGLASRDKNVCSIPEIRDTSEWNGYSVELNTEITFASS